MRTIRHVQTRVDWGKASSRGRKDGLFDFCPVGMLLNRCGGSQPGGSEGRMCKTRPTTKFVSESPGWFKNVDETSSANPRDFTDCRRRPVMFSQSRTFTCTNVLV